MACLAMGLHVFLGRSLLIPIDPRSVNPTRYFGPAVAAWEPRRTLPRTLGFLEAAEFVLPVRFVGYSLHGGRQRLSPRRVDCAIRGTAHNVFVPTESALVGEFRMALLLVFTVLVLAVISEFDFSSLARIAINLTMFMGRFLSSFRSTDAPFIRPDLSVQPSQHGSLDVRRTPSRIYGSFELDHQPVWSMPSGSPTSRAGATLRSRSPLNLRSQRNFPCMRGGRLKFRVVREERVLVSTGNVEGDVDQVRCGTLGPHLPWGALPRSGGCGSLSRVRRGVPESLRR